MTEVLSLLSLGRTTRPAHIDLHADTGMIWQHTPRAEHCPSLLGA